MSRTNPTILAFDTSAAHCSVALLIDGKIVATRHEDMARGQAERLFPMIDEVMAEVGAVWAELDAIAVGIGPGNFTGIRISVSAARGLALSLGVSAIGVRGFDALRGVKRQDDTTPMIVSLPSSRRGFDVVLQYYDDGRPEGDLVELAIFGVGGIDPAIAGFPMQAHVLGHEAAAVDFALQNDEGGSTHLTFSPSYPQVEQIAHVAAIDLASGDEIPRPAPLYIRPADALPASDSPPVILP